MHPQPSTTTPTTLYHLLLEELLNAYDNASRHKKKATKRLAFELHFERELSELAHSIINRTYTIRPSICFMVDTPVLREIIAADFRDRVVHHYIYNYLNPHLEKRLIYDCYSCREGKGTSFGIERLGHHIRSCSQNYTQPCYALQLDIQGYFMHINRSILHRKAMKLMSDIGAERVASSERLLRHEPHYEWVKYLLEEVIYHDPINNCEFRGDLSLRNKLPPSKSLLYSPVGAGLPIGNLTSQMFSNLYLNDFDQFVKRELKMRHYGRYVDDFYLLHTDKEVLKSLIEPIRKYLKENVNLDIHPNKIVLQEVKKGITFLGVHLKPYRSYMRTATKKRIRKRISALSKTPTKQLDNAETRQYLLSAANSYLGILNKTASYRLKKQLFRGSRLFDIAYGTAYLQKFVLLNENDKQQIEIAKNSE